MTLKTLKIKVRAAWCCWKDPELRLWMPSHLTLRGHLTLMLLRLLPCKTETKHLPVLTTGLFPTSMRSLWKWPVSSKDPLRLLDTSILGIPGELDRNAESQAPPENSWIWIYIFTRSSGNSHAGEQFQEYMSNGLAKMRYYCCLQGLWVLGKIIMGSALRIQHWRGDQTAERRNVDTMGPISKAEDKGPLLLHLKWRTCQCLRYGCSGATFALNFPLSSSLIKTHLPCVPLS